MLKNQVVYNLNRVYPVGSDDRVHLSINSDFVDLAWDYWDGDHGGFLVSTQHRVGPYLNISGNLTPRN